MCSKKLQKCFRGHNDSGQRQGSQVRQSDEAETWRQVFGSLMVVHDGEVCHCGCSFWHLLLDGCYEAVDETDCVAIPRR